MRTLLITVQGREGGEAVSRELDLPEYVQSQAVLEHAVAAICELWSTARDREIIESYRPG